MQEAFGGVINMIFLSLFLLIIIGVLGLVVSYTKAFKMKNVIISHIENYEASGCFSEGSACMNRIKGSAQALGYGSNIRCPDGFHKIDKLFCYKELDVDGTKDHVSDNPKRYRIITQVDLKLPIISTIFSMEIFQITGDTRVIETK